MWIQISESDEAALYELIEIAKDTESALQIEERLKHYKDIEPGSEAYRRAASSGPSGDCDVDDEAVVSRSDEGAYVMCWCWVPEDSL